MGLLKKTLLVLSNRSAAMSDLNSKAINFQLKILFPKRHRTYSSFPKVDIITSMSRVITFEAASETSFSLFVMTTTFPPVLVTYL